MQDMTNEDKITFDGLSVSPSEGLHIRSAEMNSSDCALTPDNCQDGLSVQFSLKGISFELMVCKIIN